MSDSLNQFVSVPQQFPIISHGLTGSILNGSRWLPVNENPPFINKGGITLTSSFSSVSFLTPPTPKIKAFIDYLTFTAPLSGCVASVVIDEKKDWRSEDPAFQVFDDRSILPFPTREDYFNDWDDAIRMDWDMFNSDLKSNWLGVRNLDASSEVAAFLIRLAAIVPMLEFVSCGHGFSGYKHTFNLVRDGQNCGKAAWGGNNNTFMISLTGVGCSGVDMVAMKDFLSTVPFVKLTRVDCSHDDLEGKLSYDQLKRLYYLGCFHIRGASPSFKFIESKSGNTGYVGKKQSGKEFCFYQKGRQLGNLSSVWMRYEGRFYASGGVLPLDMLVFPAVYLSGMYPPLRHLSAVHERIEVIKKQGSIALELMTDYARLSYGKFINVLVELGRSSDEIVAMLIRDGIPKRLELPFAPCPF